MLRDGERKFIVKEIEAYLRSVKGMTNKKGEGGLHSLVPFLNSMLGGSRSLARVQCMR